MKGRAEGRDAYGREMYDALRGENAAPEIVERDDGWIAISGGPSAYFAPFAKWPTHERKAVRFARGRVLDVGAGAGRVALHLQEHGSSVTAIDNSPLAVKVARVRGVKDARVAPVEAFEAPAGAFDSIVMFGNNFGLFGGARLAKRLLRRFHRMTSERGRIVAVSTDPYDTAVREHLHYQRRNRARGRMSGQIRIRIRYRSLASPWFDYLLASREEVCALVKGTGWRVARFIDSKRGPAYAMVLEKTPASTGTGRKGRGR